MTPTRKTASSGLPVLRGQTSSRGSLRHERAARASPRNRAPRAISGQVCSSQAVPLSSKPRGCYNGTRSPLTPLDKSEPHDKLLKTHQPRALRALRHRDRVHRRRVRVGVLLLDGQGNRVLLVHAAHAHRPGGGCVSAGACGGAIRLSTVSAHRLHRRRATHRVLRQENGCTPRRAHRRHGQGEERRPL